MVLTIVGYALLWGLAGKNRRDELKQEIQGAVDNFRRRWNGPIEQAATEEENDK